MTDSRVAYRTCPLCEATCGLELTIEGERIVRVRGDRDHVFSKGFLCPKGASFNKLIDDPDRLRRPLVDGREASWDEAFAVVADRLRPIIDEYGADAVAVYLGNPNSHTMAGGLYLMPLLRTLRTKNSYSASTVDQMPKHVQCSYMFGDHFAIPVPDLDRTDFLLMLGADPLESNGSLCTAADFPGGLEALKERGGRFVVVDPRRSRTAAAADEHLFIRPGTDAYLLFAVVHTLFDEGLVALRHLADHVVGIDDVHRLAKDFPPERVAVACGIDSERIRLLARELAAASAAAVYGRIGTTTTPFGTLASWLVDVVNVLTGNLDRTGGAMFPMPAHKPRVAGPGRPLVIGRWKSRVRQLPEVFTELPVATMVDEIETPGEGQVRALITVAGNPARSTQNSARLETALSSLDFMLSVDSYLNETTRHADVVLPPNDPVRKGHYDFNFLGNAVRNFAAYSPPVLPPDPGAMDECDILAKLTMIIAGAGPDADPEVQHQAMLDQLLERTDGIEVTGDSGPERVLDAMLQTGAYGLSLAELKANPHGIDLGPLAPRIPDVLRTQSRKIELCPPPIAADVPRLLAALQDAPTAMVLVGRRHVRSNNSWMHNLPTLVKGKPRCTLHVHPDDAARLGLGAIARVRSRVGEVLASVEITDDVMPGVVSLPHGWGHDATGTRLSVASAHAGVNSNLLTDEQPIDPLSGNGVLNGIPVEVTPVRR